MKNIDIKSLIIGVFLTATLFFGMGRRIRLMLESKTR